MGRLSGSQESSPALRLPLLVLMGNEEDALAMAELATDEDGPNTQPASAQLFEKLEVIRIEESGLVCSICLGHLSIGSEARQLPCSHVYHGNCIMERLKKNYSGELNIPCLPLLVRAYDDTDLRIQEEVLKKSSSLAKQLDVQLVKHSILPRVHGLALKRTIAVKKRGVTVTDSGVPEVKTAPFPNGLQSQALSKTSGTVPPASKKSSLISAVPGQQTTASCPPVDIEWPPRASSSVTPQLRDADKQLNTGASCSSSFDDLDPFANWPPRPSGSSSASGTSNNGSLGSMGNNYSTSLNASMPNNMNFQAN
ncbi:hypothetical protein GH714_014520 [Hevea brasiliensis]|uniref:RING-type domain-containing protein n=1 Tax=Hevea brasiliensis TaxID=3981 RepID=A0A6A6KNN8_HEVBR|nr:hypothetical protein GH714_014520 [Hevea brasiliensis]